MIVKWNGDTRPGSTHAAKGHPPTSLEEERWRRRRKTLKKYQLMRAAWKPDKIWKPQVKIGTENLEDL
jgi:hypothetical protein